MRLRQLAWVLLLPGACLPGFARGDEAQLFGEVLAAKTPADNQPADEVATEEAPADETTTEASPAEETPADEPASESGDDLFGERESAAEETTPAEDESLPAARKIHTRDEIKAALIQKNVAIAAQMTGFIEMNKQIARKAVTSGKQDELMPILREYGPAVIRTKQLWLAVVGNPAKYDTWLGSDGNRKAWGAFHRSWNSLYGFTDKFAAIDIDLADRLSDGLAVMGTSLDDYNAWVDEWDAEVGNDTHAFARGEDRLNEINAEQMREEEQADIETEKASADQTREEEDETAPSIVEESQEGTEMADEEILSDDETSADQAGDEAAEADQAAEDEAIEGGKEAPAEDAPADEEVDFGEGVRLNIPNSPSAVFAVW